MGTTYSFKDVSATIAGPTGSANLGFGAAIADEGITIDMLGDKDTMHIGADGTPMHSLHADKSGHITIRALKTSPLNAILQAMYDAQQISSTLWAQNVIIVRENQSGDTTTSLADFNRSAVQHLSRQVRQLMLGAMEKLPAGRCEYSSTTLAVSTERLPRVLERIARFRRELIALLEQNPARDDVYQLEINFFPVTTLQSDEESTRGTTRDAVADPGEGAR